MDINYKDNNFEFILRTSALIYNSTLDKILLFKGEDRNFYLLPGGKIEKFDESRNSLIREMKEEIGENFSKINFNFFAISEEFLEKENLKFHQINIIYKGIYCGDIIDKFKGLESDWLNFEWINILDLDKINIYPKNIKEILNNNDIHFISKVNEKGN